MTGQLESRRVRDIMTAAPAIVSPDTHVWDLMRLFDSRDFNSLPVVDTQGVLVGIVTKLDLLRVFRPNSDRRVPDAAQVEETTAADLMRPGIITLEPDQPLVAAIDLMLQSRLHSLPVVERPHGGPPLLVGILSRGDLLRALAVVPREQPAAEVTPAKRSGRGRSGRRAPKVRSRTGKE